MSDYGFAASGTWVLDGVVGFVAASVGFGVWLSLGSAAGWADVAVALTAPEGSLLIGLGIAFVGQALNIWVQETIFMGMVLKSAAEGLAQRGVTASWAVVSAWVVAVSLFTVAHGPVTLGRAVSLGPGLGVFGLLYVQTGDLALPIGVHAGMNYVGGVLVVSPSAAAQRVSLVEVTTSLSGVLGSLNSGAVPQAVIAYLVVLGWLRLRHRPWSIRLGLTEWTER